MSLILEALKKSEAKRRLGEAPDLGTPFAAPRRRSKIVPVAVVLIVAALAWWAWHISAPSNVEGAATARSAATTPVATGLAPPAGQKSGPTLRAVTGGNDLTETPPPANLPKTPPPITGDAFVPVGPMNGNAMANGGKRRTPEEIRERRRGASIENAARLSAYENAGRTPPVRSMSAVPAKTVAAPPAAATAPVAAATASASKPVATLNSPVVASAPASAQTPSAKPVVPLASSTTNVPAASRAPKTPGTIGLPDASAAPPAVAAPATQGAGAQTYSELPFSVRKSLPELRLSMHVYVADPAQRFVILNDSRLAEGEKTTDDVNIREIRPDGVVLEFQGQRFFYPRDGL